MPRALGEFGNRKLAIENSWTCSSAESERDSAKVEVTRSSRVRSTKISAGIAHLEEALVLETSQWGFESLGRYQLIMWVVAQFAEQRTVTAPRKGSTPFDPPKTRGAPN